METLEAEKKEYEGRTQEVEEKQIKQRGTASLKTSSPRTPRREREEGHHSRREGRLKREDSTMREGGRDENATNEEATRELLSTETSNKEKEEDAKDEANSYGKLRETPRKTDTPREQGSHKDKDEEQLRTSKKVFPQPSLALLLFLHLFFW